MDELDKNDAHIKTILYSFNPSDNVSPETVLGSFQTGEAVSKWQRGKVWRFNDDKKGKEEHLTLPANEGYLAGFIMLTDSISFLSYARYEYFRCILCNLLGTRVENWEFPSDDKTLKTIVESICFKNAEQYCDF